MKRAGTRNIIFYLALKNIRTLETTNLYNVYLYDCLNFMVRTLYRTHLNFQRSHTFSFTTFCCSYSRFRLAHLLGQYTSVHSQTQVNLHYH